MKHYLFKSDPGTPFSGSAQHGGTRSQRRNNRNKGSTKGNKQTAQANPRTQARTPRWSIPHGPTLLEATPAPAPATTSDYAPYVAEIQRLQAMLTAQAQSPYQDAQFGMPVPSQPATVFSASRPREFYCWLHGPENTGGNPKVGVPVHIHRPSFFRALSFSVSCVPCLLSPSHFPTLNSHTPPISSLDSSADKALALPHEATRARTAFLATHLFEQAEGSISCPQEDTRAGLAPTTVVSREQSEGHTSLPHEDTRTSARKISACTLST